MVQEDSLLPQKASYNIFSYSTLAKDLLFLLWNFAFSAASLVVFLEAVQVGELMAMYWKDMSMRALLFHNVHLGGQRVFVSIQMSKMDQ